MGVDYTAGGIPIPDDNDPVQQGAARIRDVGNAVDKPWTPLVLTAAWVAQPNHPPVYRVVAGILYLAGSISAVAATWSGAVSAFTTIADPLPIVGVAATAQLGLINLPMAFSELNQPAVARLGWCNVRYNGTLCAYAAATPATAIVACLDSVRYRVAVVNPDNG